MNIDLEKASRALSNLKDPKRGESLDSLHQALQRFRAALGVELNDAEFRYVMQTLFNEQVVTVKPDSMLARTPAVTLEHGFTIRAVI